MATISPPFSGADDGSTAPSASEPPRHLVEVLLGIVLAIIRAPVSVPMSLLWMANAQWYAVAESRLRTHVHEDKSVLPAAWTFFQMFGKSPYHYKDDFSHLASHSGEAAWIAEAVIGDHTAYRLRLNLPIRVTLFTRKVFPNGEAQYSIAAVARSDRSFSMIPNGFQIRLTQSEWDNVAEDLSKPSGVFDAILTLKKSGSQQSDFYSP